MYLFKDKRLREEKTEIERLESENYELREKLAHITAERDKIVISVSELKKQIDEVNTINLKLSKENDEQKDCINNQKEISEKLQVELRKEKSEKNDILKKLQKIESQNDDLKRKQKYYSEFTPEKYIKLGTECFTLEQLHNILENTLSSKFVEKQKEQQRIIVQRMVHNIQLAMCPIKTDFDLLDLLGCCGNHDEVELIKKLLDATKFGDVLQSEYIDKKAEVLVKTLQADNIDENIPLMEAKDANEYFRKVAIGRFVDVLNKIALIGSDY